MHADGKLGRWFAAIVAALPVAVLLGACGGGGGNGGVNTPNPPSGGSTNPCASTAVETEAPEAPRSPEGLIERKRSRVDGSPQGRVLDAIWTHRAARLQGAPEGVGPNAVDVGDVAVLEDRGDLILSANQYDLRSTGLRFTRNSAGGYDVRRIDGTFRGTLGTRLTLGDDDSAQANVAFPFSFYGQTETTAFVNSDGNITFEEEDKSSSDRNVARLLTGPPRVAPFLADLDPSSGGRVYVNAAPDQYTVTWCIVPGFDSANTTTVQTTLLPDGSIEMKYGETITLPEAVVGISPGRTGDFTPVNLSDQGPTAGGTGAVGERFADSGQLDVAAVGHRFFQSHPDQYDQLVMWTDTTLIRNAFAYETTVANEIRGIGIDIYDASRQFGSSGRLRSYVVMDALTKYPDDPLQRVLGPNNTVSVLGQEVGHRWLAFLEFRDRNGQRSDELLGRDLAHWSFFFDSDASVMEGNDIEDLGGGSFRTVAAVQRYSRLDQYAMGLLPPSEVPPFFYVESPTNVVPVRERDDAPRVGVTFNGTRRDVLIQDVIAVHGERQPSAAGSPKVHRQAFLYIVSSGRTADPAQIDKVDRIRKAWETFFAQATDGRMQAITRLQ